MAEVSTTTKSAVNDSAAATIKTFFNMRQNFFILFLAVSGEFITANCLLVPNQKSTCLPR
jgi:hypothetical protein